MIESAEATNGGGRSGMNEYLTPEELCAWLGIKRATVYEWTHTGFVPHFKLGGRLRFRRSEIERWMEAKHRPGRFTRIP